MAKRIYVGNLPFRTTEAELRELFAAYGTVQSVNLITDRETGQPRGFGFVEMDDAGADAAVSALADTLLGGRTLKVNEAKPRQDHGYRRG